MKGKGTLEDRIVRCELVRVARSPDGLTANRCAPYPGMREMSTPVRLFHADIAEVDRVSGHWMQIAVQRLRWPLGECPVPSLTPRYVSTATSYSIVVIVSVSVNVVLDTS
jgi:hypothetical protein